MADDCKEDDSTTTEFFNKLVAGCYSNNPLGSLITLRRLTTSKEIVQRIIDCNVVPQMIKLLKLNNGEIVFNGFIRDLQINHIIPLEIIRLCIVYGLDEDLQSETIWIITNITAGSSKQTKYVVECDVIPVLINSFWLTTSNEVATNSIWALGNICSQCALYRDLILSKNILKYLVRLFHDRYDQLFNLDLKLLTNAARTLCNLCASKPKPKQKYIQKQYELLIYILEQYHMHVGNVFNEEIMEYVCWGFSCLVDCDDIDDPFLKCIVAETVLSKIISLLNFNTVRLVDPILKILGFLTFMNEEYAQSVIDCGGLSSLNDLLQRACDKNNKCIKSVCYILSNIATGSEEQIQSMIDSDLMVNLIPITMSKYDDVQQEALYAVYTAIFNANQKQIEYLISIQIIGVICEQISKLRLNIKHDILLMTLQVIQHIITKTNNKLFQSICIGQLNQYALEERLYPLTRQTILGDDILEEIGDILELLKQKQ